MFSGFRRAPIKRRAANAEPSRSTAGSASEAVDPPLGGGAPSPPRRSFWLGAPSKHDYGDRGTGEYELARERLALPSLVETGRHAGRSRVVYVGRHLGLHLFTRDFFITVANASFGRIVAGVAGVYLVNFWLFGLAWYGIMRGYPECLGGDSGSLAEAWVFAVITTMTIGYGNTNPGDCWAAAWLVALQAVTATVTEAIVLGVVFARISHPKQRARSIYISDSAVVARRDGILKLMFRVADVRRTQVVEPRVKAFLYTWGAGRLTAEGEAVPVRCEELDIGYIDGMLILPLIIEHTIDERSPLCGHTHESLVALSAEVVVTFEGTTEFGNPFMARQSYLAAEIHWGCTFAPVIRQPAPGQGTHYSVDLGRFHEVRLQPGVPPGLTPAERSRAVVLRARRTVPYPLLGENTLALADLLCVAPLPGRRLRLSVRVADTYPNQMLDVTAKAFLFRWGPAGAAGSPTAAAAAGLPAPQLEDADAAAADELHFPGKARQLEVGYTDGSDRLFLRVPQEVSHVIDARSPLARWLEPGGLEADADAEIAVTVTGYLHSTGQIRLRQRTYRVGTHVRYGHAFVPVVVHPAAAADRKPRVRWGAFHSTAPLPAGAWPEGLPPPRPYAPAPPEATAAPESHAVLRSQETWHRARAGGLSLPQLAGIDARNDFTVVPASALSDLARYAATTGEMGSSLPRARPSGEARPSLPAADAFGGAGGAAAAAAGPARTASDAASGLAALFAGGSPRAAAAAAAAGQQQAPPPHVPPAIDEEAPAADGGPVHAARVLAADWVSRSLSPGLFAADSPAASPRASTEFSRGASGGA